MNVAHDDAFAELRRIGVGVEKGDAAVSRLLMAVVRDRANRNRERREGARLPLVMTGLDEMEEMIVRPMTRLDYRAALGVPRKTVGIARAFGNDLEFMGAGVHAPERAIEFVLAAIVRLNAALIEYAVQPVEPSVGSPRQRIGQFVCVRAA